MIGLNNTTEKKIPSGRALKLAAAFLKAYRRSGDDLSIAVVGRRKMRTLNRLYRGLDKPTDVLSFSGGPGGLGEIIIDYEEAWKPGKYLEVFGVREDPDYIFLFLLVHGLLHLVGYEDDREADRREMLRLGSRFLEKNGISGRSGTL